MLDSDLALSGHCLGMSAIAQVRLVLSGGRYRFVERLDDIRFRGLAVGFITVLQTFYTSPSGEKD